MKNLLKLFVLLVMLSCNKNQDETENTESKEILYKEELNKYDLVDEIQDKDTINNFRSIDLDTIKSSQIIKRNKEDFELKIYNYSLNDSSIVKNVGDDSYHVNFDIYHNRVSEIILKKNNKNIISKIIDKNNLKISNKEFNQYSIIKYTEFMFRKDGELFFESTLNVPDTDWVEKIEFSILKDNPYEIKVL
ncbi:hypothetical protein IUY40_15130 [Flavobacterium sp. ALJ2]|uniref:hypothetical protein n=1 Tax=Flavobacterium sp. ALJ2 TaxID=2786960 RepID=UPI00189F6535|nr:hypothetical protein [Flavobacterium sp. ALJ2]MBF7092867.1 hypothetical protein [Flavobacterium sp. ALJ2]